MCSFSQTTFLTCLTGRLLYIHRGITPVYRHQGEGGVGGGNLVYEGTHRKLSVLTLLRQVEQGVAAVPESDLAQLVQIVEAPLQGGGAQGLGLLIHCLCQLHAASVHLRTERLTLLRTWLPARQTMSRLGWLHNIHGDCDEGTWRNMQACSLKAVSQDNCCSLTERMQLPAGGQCKKAQGCDIHSILNNLYMQ